MTAELDVEVALCVFREANDALILFDPRDRRVVDTNPTAQRLTGLDRKSLLAMKIGDLISAPDPDAFRRLVLACQHTGFFHAQDGYFLAVRDRPPIPVNVSVSRIHTRPDPLGLAMVRDISPRVRAEAELREARDLLESRVRERTAELDEANRVLRAESAGRARVEDELRRAKEAAESAGRVKDRFLAVLSHELRTPLTPVLAVVSALLDGPEAPDALRPTLEMIRRSVSLEARLIDDLLDVMVAARGRLALELGPVDARAPIERAIESCRDAAEAAGVEIVAEFRARDHRVMADPSRLRQVAWNLIDNALKCAQGTGTVRVGTATGEGGRLVVTVEDDGRGIDPEVLPTIFEPFEQGQSALRRRPSGLGLGLSVSRSIVEGHGGRLTARSDGPGLGASFTFDLPPAPRPGPMPREIPPTSAPTDGPGARILLVEDNKDVLRYLKLVLEMKGHRVHAAADLASARAEVGAEADGDRPFDLLISDIELPDGSGLDLMRDLRGRVPGLAISGFGSPDDIRMSLEAGFARHLTKPIEAGRLEAAIREVVAPAGRSAAG